MVLGRDVIVKGVDAVVVAAVGNGLRRVLRCDPSQLRDSECCECPRKEAFFAVVGIGRCIGQVDMAVEHPVKSPGDLIDMEYAHEISVP